MKLAWLTDIHFNFLRPPALEAFLESLAETEADAFLIGGDIGEAPDVALHLNALANALQRPIYFVLGNHDFYRGSITGVREKASHLCSACPNLHYLSNEGVIPLTVDTCLIGHDGWGDGRLGDYHGSDVLLNDFGLIEEFGGFDEDPAIRLSKIHVLGDEAATHFRKVLPEAVKYKNILVLTHVPPFKESCWHEGKTSGDAWLPFFSCKAVGGVLAEAMERAADRQMTVLCGHTHGAGEAQILPNLKVITGGAIYGQPVIQQVLEF